MRWQLSLAHLLHASVLLSHGIRAVTPSALARFLQQRPSLPARRHSVRFSVAVRFRGPYIIYLCILARTRTSTCCLQIQATPSLTSSRIGRAPVFIASPKGVDFDSINRAFYVGFVEALERDCIGIGRLATVFCCFSLAFSFWKCFWGHSTPFGGICGRFPSAVQHFCGEFPRVWRILFVGVLPHLRLGFHSASQGYYFGVFFLDLLHCCFSKFSVCLEPENTSFLCFLHCYILAINWVLLASRFSLSCGLSGPSLEHQG